MRKKWTKEEIDFLKDNYYSMTYKELIKELNKTRGIIGYQLLKLKLPRKSKVWTKQEIKFLKRNYYKLNNKEILKKVNHPLGSLLEIATRLSLNKEIKICKKCGKKYKIKPHDSTSFLCPKCKKPYYKKHYKNWRNNHKKQAKIYAKKYKEENESSLKKKRSEYYQKNKQKRKKKDKEYYLKNKEKIIKYHRKLYEKFREKENQRRKELGLPLMEEARQSISEQETKIYLDKIFPNEKFIDNKKYKWLKKLELDRYYPKLKIAFEYNGHQHYMPRRFGNVSRKKAEKNFKEQKQRDLIKKKLCIQNKIILIIIKYDEKLSKQLILNKLEEKGIMV